MRPAPTFDWSLLETFLAVVDAGSYSAAAQRRGAAQPTVGRQMAQLERQLGVALFERAGRSVVPTPAALGLVEHARTMAESALRVGRLAAGQSSSLEGVVRITASEVDAAVLLAPLVPSLRASFPGIELEILATSEAKDLRRREADLALRRFETTEPELVSRRLRDGRARLYAATRYLRSLGRVTPTRLREATFIGFDRTDTYRRGLEALGLALPDACFPVLANHQFVQWALVKAGVGIGIMLEEVGDAEPGVARVLPALPVIALPLWLVSHREVHTSQRVRVIADAMFEALRGERELDELTWRSRGKGRGTVQKRR